VEAPSEILDPGPSEPLKGNLTRWCSRRIAERCGEQRLEIAQCRYHY
jgi:Txe/YoeB family toxin of Txe-Axe toxin-antitoxin module